jgi:hypothetical protein
VCFITILNARDTKRTLSYSTDVVKVYGDTALNRGSKKVIIWLRAVEINGEKHLAMIDSHGQIAIDSLETTVPPGAKIIWLLEHFSGIKKITQIHSAGKGPVEIFKKEAKKRFLCKGFKLKLSKDLATVKREKYEIIYIHWDNTTVPIDPYIRILPPTQ